MKYLEIGFRQQNQDNSNTEQHIRPEVEKNSVTYSITKE